MSAAASVAEPRLSPRRAAELEEQGSLSNEQRPPIEALRASLHQDARGLAHNARVAVGVGSDAPIRALLDRIDVLIGLHQRLADRAHGVIGRQLTREERIRLSETTPNLTAWEVIDAGRRGRRGFAAVR